MSTDSYAALQNAKAALDQGLIDTADYQEVKTAFLRAQQIRAGLDAGFIRVEDYNAVKRSFLHSLNLVSVPEPAAANGRLQSGLANGDSELTPRQEVGVAEPVSSQQELAKVLPSSPPPVPQSPAAQQPVSAAPSAEPSPRGRAAIPTNIPKMGGARRKQASGTSMSGISVGDDAVNLYYFLKAKSTYRWATWKINDAGNEVIIADVGEKDSTYADFLTALPENDCRYGVYDYQFTNSEGCIFNKIIFLNWAPDNARIKLKMMYASTKDFFKGYLDGLSIELQGSELDDVSEQEASTSVRSSITRQ